MCDASDYTLEVFLLQKASKCPHVIAYPSRFFGAGQ